MPPAVPPARSESAAAPRRGFLRRRATLVTVSAVAVIAALLYAERGRIGAELATRYLKSHGVPSRLVIDRLGPNGFVAHGVLGPAADPDLSIERAEVDFDPAPLFRGSFVPRVTAVRLFGPRLKAAWRNGRLTFGSLQSLIDETAASPGEGPSPAITVQRGELRLATPAGPMRLTGDARLDQGRLMNLDGRLDRTVLTGEGLKAEIAGGVLSVRPAGEGLSAKGRVTLSRLTRGDIVAQDVRLDLSARAPYPAERFSGPLALALSVAAGELRSGQSRLDAPRLALSLDGHADGPLETVAFTGAGKLGLSAKGWRGASAGGAAVSLDGGLAGIRLARAPEGVRVALTADLAGRSGATQVGAARLQAATVAARLYALDGLIAAGRGMVSATPQLTISTDRLQFGDTVATGVAGVLAGEGANLAWGRDGWSLTSGIHLQSRAQRVAVPVSDGRFVQQGVFLNAEGRADLGKAAPALSLVADFGSRGGGATPAAARALAEAVPVLSTDAGGKAALERAFRSVRISAPAVGVRIDGDSLDLSLPKPVAFDAAGGARASLAQPRAGALAFRLEGGGLPDARLDLAGYRLGQDRGGLTLSTAARLDVRFSGVSYKDARLALAGRALRRGGTLTFSAPECGTLSLGAFGEGPEPLVTKLTGKACAQAGAPLLALGPHDWRLSARLQDLRFDAPASEAGVREGAVVVDLHGDPRSGEPAGAADIVAGRLVDVAKEIRFQPLQLSGRADLAGGVWTGPIELKDASGQHPVAEVRVRHVMDTGVGHADIAAPMLAFSKGGLQPRDLTPIGADMVTQAQGVVSFTGEADWREGELTSRGRMETHDFAFRSPFGQVQGAEAALDFTSLAPLISAPDQPVSAKSVAWLVPLENPSARIALKEDRLSVTGAKAGVGQGSLSLDPIDFPFDPQSTLTGTVRIENLELETLIERFNLSDKVKLEATVDGALPFTYGQSKLRLANGKIFATRPGRLSIDPQALTGASASAPGAPPAAPTPGMQAFAYQALQDLAFDTLEAGVDSRPGGRLGLLFHIKGRHDPPKGGDVRLGVLDLLRGKAFDKPIDLPKGTPVNLTLDTSLNLDELLAAYGAQAQLAPARSDAVQAEPATPEGE